MTDEVSAIEGTRRQTRETADGSLEVKIVIEPRDKAKFWRLFGEIDTRVALALLKNDPAA